MHERDLRIRDLLTRRKVRSSNFAPLDGGVSGRRRCRGADRNVGDGERHGRPSRSWVEDAVGRLAGTSDRDPSSQYRLTHSHPEENE
eukprot:2249460-Prymnesium_polylepis.1